MPMVACFPDGIARPPRERQAAKFKPPGRKNRKTVRQFLISIARDPIVMRDETFRRGKSGLAQQFRSVIEPSRDLRSRVPLKLKHVVMIAVLHHAESVIRPPAIDQFGVARDGTCRCFLRAEKEALGLTAREVHVGAHMRNRREIHGHAALEKWSVQPLEKVRRRQRICVVVANDYVVHRLCFPAISSR